MGTDRTSSYNFSYSDGSKKREAGKLLEGHCGV